MRRIVQQPIASIVARDVRARIVDGTFAPGEQLGEEALAEQFGVSRGPIREAVQRLVQEGLLESIPRRGVFVRRLRHEDVSDVYLARKAVELAAAEYALDQPDEAAFRTLGRMVQRMHAAAAQERWNELVELDLAFHEMLVQAAKSERLSRMFRTLAAETRLCLNGLKAAYPELPAVAAEHEQLLSALKAGDRKKFARLLEGHLDEAAVTLTRAQG